MKKYFLVVIWAIAGILGGNLINEIGYILLNDATTGISKWRAIVPALLGFGFSVFCFSQVFKTWKGRDFFKKEESVKDDNSPIQNEKVFEYVAIVLLAILLVPNSVKSRLLQIIVQ